MKIALLLATAATLALAGSASAATYNFIQTGFDGGGVLKLSFTGVDANHDGIISGGRSALGTTSNEISTATISLTGDRLIADFQETFWNGSIYYTLGTAQLGTANGDGVSHDGNTAGYSTGFFWGNPNGDSSVGGLVYYVGGRAVFATDETPNQLQRVPEPAAFALLGLGAAALGMTSRRRG